MADERLFRVTYDSGSVRYLRRKALGLVAANTKAYGYTSYRLGRITRIEAVKEADVPWTDVTGEFL